MGYTVLCLLNAALCTLKSQSIIFQAIVFKFNFQAKENRTNLCLWVSGKKPIDFLFNIKNKAEYYLQLLVLKHERTRMDLTLKVLISAQLNKGIGLCPPLSSFCLKWRAACFEVVHTENLCLTFHEHKKVQDLISLNFVFLMKA